MSGITHLFNGYKRGVVWINVYLYIHIFVVTIETNFYIHLNSSHVMEDITT